MVLNLCGHDNANFMYDITRAMNMAGVRTEGMKRHRHSFRYPKELPAATPQHMLAKLRQADLVQIFHSDIRSLEILKISKFNGPVIVYHAGSIFRQNTGIVNSAFNPIVKKSVICLPEFSGLGAKNEVYMVGCIDTDRLQPCYGGTGFGHFPSSPGVKGTSEILKMISELKKIKMEYHDKAVPYSEQIEKIKKCAIYIELFKPILNGYPYGSFGMTALEAAALGKIVITQCLRSDVYKAHYGNMPLALAHSEDDFKRMVRMYADMDPQEILNLQKLTRQWVETKHNMMATGEYIKKHILC